MKEFFRTKNETWENIQSNLLFIGIMELLIYNGGLMIKYAVQRQVDFFTPLVGPDYAFYYNANFWIIIPILLTLAFMWLTCPGALEVFTEGSLGRKLKSVGQGLLLGFLAVAFLSLLASVSGAVTFHFNQFDWRTILGILPLFIQSSAEEILLRGYVPAIVGRKHSWDVVCFVSGTLFIFHHILNMEYYGFCTMFCLDVFLLGVLFCLLVWREGTFGSPVASIPAGTSCRRTSLESPQAGIPHPLGSFMATSMAPTAFTKRPTATRAQSPRQC